MLATKENKKIPYEFPENFMYYKLFKQHPQSLMVINLVDMNLIWKELSSEWMYIEWWV